MGRIGAADLPLPVGMRLRMEAHRRVPGREVFVREYLRFRLGKWETVRSHFRGWPRS